MKCPFCGKEWVRNDMAKDRVLSEEYSPARTKVPCQSCGKLTISKSGFCCRCNYKRQYGKKVESLSISEILAKGRLATGQK